MLVIRRRKVELPNVYLFKHIYISVIHQVSRISIGLNLWYMHTANTCRNIDIETSIQRSNERIYLTNIWAWHLFETAIFSNVYLFRIFFYYTRNHYHYLFRSFIVLEIRSFFTASPRVTTTILHDSMKIIDTSKRKIRATWNFNRGLNMLARKWTPNRRIWDGKKEKEKRKEKKKKMIEDEVVDHMAEMRCRRRSLQCTQVLKRWVRKQRERSKGYSIDRSILLFFTNLYQ